MRTPVVYACGYTYLRCRHTEQVEVIEKPRWSEGEPAAVTLGGDTPDLAMGRFTRGGRSFKR
jgi:hypothetical protein